MLAVVIGLRRAVSTIIVVKLAGVKVVPMMVRDCVRPIIEVVGGVNE